MTAIFIAVLVAAISAFATYVVAARRLSGRIATTEADSLWKESAAIREDYRARITAAEERQARLEERIAKLEQSNNDLREENLKLIQANIEKAHEIAILHETVDSLTTENNALRSTIRKMGS